jgi:outer membrane murein-binding lipoprotein Lpp
LNRTTLAFALVAATLAGGCAHRAKHVEAAPAKSDWHRIITDTDRDRLRNWHDSWAAAMDKARAAGKGPLIAAQGPLFDPDRALSDGATPPPGRYKCRVFKIGANGPAMQDYTFYPTADCEVDDEGDVSSFYKVAGAQRPVGLLFTDTPARSIFLGTLELGDETKAMSYGQDTSRDMVGFVERIGPKRWRLVLPAPRFESLLDVVELTPAPTR